MRIAGLPQDDAALLAAFNAVEDARGDIPLTYFEYGTLAAFHAFAGAGLDVAILEVGLGGRLDAVNVVAADVAVVTSIDLDHMDYLGPTREDIAREKAGIFRAGRPVVCAEPDPPSALIEHARVLGAPVTQIGRDYGFVAEERQWRYWGPGGSRFGLPYPALRGAYQLANAATVLAVVDLLRDRLHVSAGAIRDGLLGVELQGRFQVLPGRPAIVLDVAHNPHAARALAATLGTMGYFPETTGGLRHARRQGRPWRDRCRGGAHRPLVRRDAARPTWRVRRRDPRANSGARESRRTPSARSPTSDPRSPLRAARRVKLIESSFSDRS